MPVIKEIRPAWVIHIFAISHALVASLCRIGNFEDELLLTILTMAMSLIICYKKNVSIEFTAAVIIVGNIIGYLMGTLGARIFELAFNSPLVIHALSTFVTTEVLGWSIIAITKMFRHGSFGEHQTSLSPSYMRWILLAAAGIFMTRICIVLFLAKTPVQSNSMLVMTQEIFSNPVALTSLICINIIYVRFAGRLDISKVANILIFISFMLASALIETVIVGFGIPFRIEASFSSHAINLFIVSLIAQVTIYCIVYIINYAITARSEMQAQKEKAHTAQYRYLKLKRQVNPHFLFNSLNILDCLVCEEKTEQASTYIHKLAGIYRYMIKSEDEDLVPLSDELTFVGLYVDLLKIRFPEGFDVEVNVPERVMSRYVLPCSLQLLLENATKHNAVTPEKPLLIKIDADDEKVKVHNNVIPKISKSPSTGLGQKYIRRQYYDLSGKEIEIQCTENDYCVTLPLL